MATPEDERSPEGYERRLYNATLKYDGFEPDEIFLANAVWIDPADAEEISLLNRYLEMYQNAYDN